MASTLQERLSESKRSSLIVVEVGIIVRKESGSCRSFLFQ